MDKKIAIFALMFLILFLSKKNLYCHGATYEAQYLKDNKIKITIKSNDEIKKGVKIKYFYFEKLKVLHVGYEFEKNTNFNYTSDSIEIPLNSVIPPIIVILENKDFMVFSDIDKSSYKENILHLHDCGIINGYSNNRFIPENSITRAEFIAILLKSLNKDVKNNKNNNFKDLKYHWAKNYMYLANELGYIKGYNDKTIKPDNKITIAESAVIIKRAFKVNTKFEGIYTKLEKDKWYSDSVKYLFDSTILSVFDKIYNNFDEESYLTREEAALIISRTLSVY
ncbi:MAG: S-layer homology domain-containing protein [Clostridiales bacterium]